MNTSFSLSRILAAAPVRLAATGSICAFALACTLAAQEPPPIPNASTATTAPTTKVSQPASTKAAPAPEDSQAGGITEDELRQMLAGKPLYLRGGYLDDSLSFNQSGALVSHSAQGSYTLCVVEINKVHLTKHKVELEGIRYGLHFLGALPYEDPAKAVDRVRITPKKKFVHITIEREAVVKPKKHKEEKAAPNFAQSADTSSATTSQAHATQVLKQALDRIFAPGLDQRMVAAMPDFWKLYYKAAAAKTDFRPSDPAVLRESVVDRKARLLTAGEPESNQYAQDAQVAGVALYHVIVQPDGTPGEIVVARPIGFGLDENAVAALRKAKFEPAMKDGKPVPVLLDLVVQFRIYSKRTAAEPEAGSAGQEAEKPSKPVLPGPYSIGK